MTTAAEHYAEGERLLAGAQAMVKDARTGKIDSEPTVIAAGLLAQLATAHFAASTAEALRWYDQRVAAAS